VEAYAHDGETDQLTIMNHILDMAYRSDAVNEGEFAVIGRTDSGVPDGAIAIDQSSYLDVGQLRALAERASRYLAICPIAYTALLGISQGVRVGYADAQAWELIDLYCRDYRRSFLRWRPPFSVARRKEMAFRDNAKVRTIAKTALTMHVQNPADPPELHYWAGSAHRRGVTKHLQHNGVAFTDDDF
jgi:hypothetical protein